MVVLVTGASGQVGQALRFISGQKPQIRFHFSDSSEADITDRDKLLDIFSAVKPDYCINAAAYTAVDKAESEPEKATSINVTGAENLAALCQQFHVVLIHISTDFVFDGRKRTPYTESDETNPKSVYGLTKRNGEVAITAILKRHFIIRTSWVYSGFGNNFMKTMLRLASERSTLNIVNDQIGNPTHALDLAEAILNIIVKHNKSADSTSLYGIYNYSSEGEASWYDLAKKIFELSNVSIDLKPIPTSEYPTPAQRPFYSVLDKSKIKTTFGIQIDHWAEALQKHV
jgi:dTDP-4-dehydrorhamnose reductase